MWPFQLALSVDVCWYSTHASTKKMLSPRLQLFIVFALFNGCSSQGKFNSSYCIFINMSRIFRLSHSDTRWLGCQGFRILYLLVRKWREYWNTAAFQMHFRETVIFLECRLQTKICYGYNNIAVYICPANAVCNIDSDVCGGPYLSFSCLSIGLCSNNMQ